MAFGSISVAYPDGRQKIVQLSAAGIRIGSMPDNDLVLAGAGVAPHHAVIDCDERFCEITDVGSSAGTLVDGVRLLINFPQELDYGAVIQIGDVVLCYMDAEAAPEASSLAAQPAARVPTTPLKPSDLPADLPDISSAAEPPRVPTTPLKLSDLPADLPDVPPAAEPPRVPTTPLKLSDLPADLPPVAPSPVVQAVLPQLVDPPVAASLAAAGVAPSLSSLEGPASEGAAVALPPTPRVQTQPLKPSDLPANMDAMASPPTPRVQTQPLKPSDLPASVEANSGASLAAGPQAASKIVTEPLKGGDAPANGAANGPAVARPVRPATQPIRLSDNDLLLSMFNQPLSPRPAAQAPVPLDDLLSDLLSQSVGRPRAMPPRPAAPPPTPPSALLIALNHSEVRIKPGETATVMVAVANRGTVADTVQLSLEGVPSGGYTFTPSEITLRPHTHEEVQLNLHPPDSHSARAGTYPFRVIARSRLSGPAAIEATLEVEPVYNYALKLAPHVQTAGYSAQYRLTVENNSNADLPLTLFGKNAQYGLRFRFPRPQVVAPAGTDLIVPFQVTLGYTHVIGKDRPYPFTITATPTFDTELVQEVEGQFVRHPVMPPTLAKTLLALMLCSVLLLALAIPSLLLCGAVPRGLPFGQAVVERFFPICRYTARFTAPAVAAGIGASLSNAETEAAGPKAQAELATAVQEKKNQLGESGKVSADAFAATQTALVGIAQQTQTAAVNTNSGTQTALAVSFRQTATAIVDQATATAVPRQTAAAVLVQTQTALAVQANGSATAIIARNQTASAQPTTTATATNTATPSATATPTATPSATPSATPTASTTPTNTPIPVQEFAFEGVPSSVPAGVPFSGQVRVRAQDSAGNLTTTFNGQITLDLTGGTAGASLKGTTVGFAQNGVATFGGLSVDKAGSGYKLRATSDKIQSESATFNITANGIQFLTDPGSAPAGSPLALQPVVKAVDGNGNLDTTFNGTVTLSIKPGTGTANAKLSGAASKAAVNGVADFRDSNLSIDKTGAKYVLIATSGTMSVESKEFNITATKLAFSRQPGTATGGLAFGSQPEVRAVDSFGNLDTTFNGTVTLAMGANPVNGTLAGTLALKAVDGVATYGGVSINKTGDGYTLAASATGLTSATSSPFSVAVGPPARLIFSAQPGGAATGGLAFPNQPAVQVLDAGGNLTSGNTTVALAIGTNPGNGALLGTTSIAASGGVATFSGLAIDKKGSGYTLTASGTGLIGATSNAFDVVVGPPAKLAFRTQPAGATGGSAFATQPAVEIQDAGGNLTGSTATVALAIGANPSGGSLSGASSKAAIGGVATFSGLSIDKAGAGYTLAASSTGLTGATSSPFSVTPGPPATLVFSAQPGGAATGGLAFPNQPVVHVLDAGGNLTSQTVQVTLAIGANVGGGTLSGGASIAAPGGVATFSGLSIDKFGTGYTLRATSGALAPVISDPFNVTTGAAAKLAFRTQPGGGATGGLPFPTQPVVEVQDAGGNLIGTSTAQVTLAISSNPGGGALSGSASIPASGGVATFSGLSIDKSSGSGYRLTATSGTLAGVTSDPFNVTTGAAAKLAFRTQPGGNPTGGLPFPTQPVVEIQDAGGNLTGSTAAVTLAIGANPSSGTLAGTSSKAAVGGVAMFSGLAIDKQGTGYTLTASAPGLVGATSNAFNVTVGVPAKLAFSTQPVGAVHGNPLATQPVVQIQDAGGNLTNSNAQVTVAIGANPSSGTLAGTKTVSASNGSASFAGLSINNAGNGYTLTASATGLAGATSSPFNMT